MESTIWPAAATPVATAHADAVPAATACNAPHCPVKSRTVIAVMLCYCLGVSGICHIYSPAVFKCVLCVHPLECRWTTANPHYALATAARRDVTIPVCTKGECVCFCLWCCLLCWTTSDTATPLAVCCLECCHFWDNCWPPFICLLDCPTGGWSSNPLRSPQTSLPCLLATSCSLACSGPFLHSSPY